MEQIELFKTLTEKSSYNRHKLKERLVKEGLKEYKCEICGLSEWQGKPISLQLHHLNGINNDNRLSNLQLLCPNCHSQTENFGTKGKGRVLKKKIESLPSNDVKNIIDTVAEKGIVEARKILPYRNSIINAIIKANKQPIIMICPDNTELEFTTAIDASRYLFYNLGIGSNPESSASSIKRCYLGKQNSVKGYKFYKRSAEV